MYVKYVYDTGNGAYENIVEFPDNIEERYIEADFEIWFENQRREEGYWEILSEEEAREYETF